MAFRDLVGGVKTFFGPNNPLFYGKRDDRMPEADEGLYNAQNAQPTQPTPVQSAPQVGSAPQAGYMPQTSYAQPQTGYAPQQQIYGQQQSYPQIPYGAPQAVPQPSFAQPQAGYAQPPFRQQPVQQPVTDRWAAPRNRRMAQHAQPPVENVVEFPASAQQEQVQQPVTAPQQMVARVLNVHNSDDCRDVIRAMRDGDCVLAVMDSVADVAEVRRYVDTLYGACFSLGGSITRLSARVGVYLVAPSTVQVKPDPRAARAAQQTRSQQHAGGPAATFRAAFQSAPQESAQPYAYPPQPSYQPAPYQQIAAENDASGRPVDAVM
jgi:FtsZ-interacting cell division protein YlmF